MACFNPQKFYVASDGRLSSDPRHADRSKSDTPYVQRDIACGHCIGCRTDKMVAWGVRMTHETRYWPSANFLTLTYAPKHLPEGGSIAPEDVRSFRKRLLSWWRYETNGSMRHFTSAEYGENNTQRPHYHMICFGPEFPDAVHDSTNKMGNPLYTSERLNRLWGKGNVTFGAVSFTSACYAAKYAFKEVFGRKRDEPYILKDPQTSMEWPVRPPAATMSGGLGFRWAEDFEADFLHSGTVSINGRIHAVPKAYLRKYKKRFTLPGANPCSDPPIDDYAVIRRKAIDYAKSEQGIANSTQARLAIRQEVAHLRSAGYTRTFDGADL